MEELRATRRSAAPGSERRKVRREAWQQQQLRAAVTVRGTGLRRGGGDGVECVCVVVVDAQTDSSVSTRERQRAQRAAACSGGQQRETERQPETEAQRERERAAAGTLRFGWLNTLQSHPILTPSLPAHQPVRDVSQTGALLQPLFWQSHILHYILYISNYVTRAMANVSAYRPSYSLPNHVTRLPSLPI